MGFGFSCSRNQQFSQLKQHNSTLSREHFFWYVDENCHQIDDFPRSDSHLVCQDAGDEGSDLKGAQVDSGIPSSCRVSSQDRWQGLFTICFFPALSNRKLVFRIPFVLNELISWNVNRLPFIKTDSGLSLRDCQARRTWLVALKAYLFKYLQMRLGLICNIKHPQVHTVLLITAHKYKRALGEGEVSMLKAPNSPLSEQSLCG